MRTKLTFRPGRGFALDAEESAATPGSVCASCHLPRPLESESGTNQLTFRLGRGFALDAEESSNTEIRLRWHLATQLLEDESETDQLTNLQTWPGRGFALGAEERCKTGIRIRWRLAMELTN